MRIRTVVFMCVAMLVGGTGLSQTKNLGDVAGSIKLNPEAIVEKEGFVDDPRRAAKADGALLSEVLAGCEAAADLVDQLVVEAQTPTAAPDPDLRSRLTGAAMELDNEVESISRLRLTDVFDQALSTAKDAADACSSASALVRREAEGGGVIFRGVDDAVDGCKALLGRARTQATAVEQYAEGNERSGAQPSAEEQEPAAPPTDEEVVAAKCEALRSTSLEAFEACRRDQFLSQAAIASRSPENEMIDGGVFADIRRLCFELHPADFVARDGCEQEKMTAARLELE